MRISIIGCGYVGLVSGACFAEFGTEVVCVDKDASKIQALQQGIMPIYEPNLDDLVKRNINSGLLQFSQTAGEAVAHSDIVFIAVGTPMRRGDGDADLTWVYEAAKEIADYLQGYTIVVNKSTIPVGTSRNVARIIAEANPGAVFDMASNPEFLREGAAIADFMRPDRVIIGVETERAKSILAELYQPLNLIEVPIVFMDMESAELAKYASNAFLATKISFINEIATLCEAVGADVHAVAKGMGLDGRIGRKFLHPGPGYGGSCFPKDTLSLVRTAQEHDISCRIIEAVIEVNAAQSARMIKKISRAFKDDVSGKKIAVLGLTFKPETDDMRDAPSLSILPVLVDEGANISAHDPKGMANAKTILPESIEFCDDIYATVSGADAVILMTEWNLYRGLDLQKLKSIMEGNVFIDLRNVYEPRQMSMAGFDYHCVGRQTSAPPRTRSPD